MRNTTEPSQHILAGPLAPKVERELERLAAERVLPRLWEKDATLWTARQEEQQTIRHRLGWLTIAPVMEAHVEEIQREADGIRRDGYTSALLLGMGGSSLFPEVCRGVFGVAPGWLDLAVLDSTDPTAVRSATTRAPLERTLFLVSSKSGTTLETASLSDYFYEQVRRLKGSRAGEQFVAITDAGTPLADTAASRAFRRVFVHGPTTGQDVGGRFSALTYFGLVPASLMGLDVRRLLASAKAMAAACGASVAVADNPAAQLGALFGQGGLSEKHLLTFVSPARLSAFGALAEQIVAESTGKAGKGLVPIRQERLRDPHAYAADRIFVEWQLADDIDRELAQAVTALAEAGHPVVRLRWRDLDALGAEIFRWSLATAIAGTVMQLNPFDEPDVQASKDRTKALLAQAGRDGALPEDAPVLTEHGLSLYGDRAATRAHSMTEALRDLLRHAGAGDYFAILSFLPRTPTLDTAVERLRHVVADSTGTATMLGYGPRYLHSIGQLHKGGADRLRVLMLTAKDSVDVPVPGQPYSFGVLKHAQALGDFQALMDRHRRVLRVDLGASPDTAMTQLLRLAGEAAASGRTTPTR